MCDVVEYETEREAWMREESADSKREDGMAQPKNNPKNNFNVLPCVGSMKIPAPCSGACRNKRLNLDKRRWTEKPPPRSFFPASTSPNLGVPLALMCADSRIGKVIDKHK